MQGDTVRFSIWTPETWTMHMYLPRKSSLSGSLSYTSTSNSWPGTSWTMTWCTRHTHKVMKIDRGTWIEVGCALMWPWMKMKHSLRCDSLIPQIQNKVKWYMIESSNTCTCRVMITHISFHKTFHCSYLIYLFPLRRVCVVNVFGGEVLRANPQYGIGVGQASHNPFHVVVFGC